MKKGRTPAGVYAVEIVSSLLLACIAFISFMIDYRTGIIALLCFISYVAFLVVYSRTKGRSKAKSSASFALSGVLCGFLEKLDSPVMIINEANRIVWSNSRFDGLKEVREHHLSSGAGNLFGGALSYSNLRSSDDENIPLLPILTDGRNYGVRVFSLDFEKQRIYGTVWYDIENEIRLKKSLDDTSVRVAYIVIDNTSEVQDIQENLRFGSAAVNGQLTEWAAGFGAILTEYDRDKYIMQFENRYLAEMTKSRFDIIDRVVESSLAESAVPITISIGVSKENGTLEERKVSAYGALCSALQRGGALAVVKTEDGEDSYGGRTKAVQRQTRIRARLCRDLLFEKIPKSKNVIIMGHKTPDYDSIASNIGIAKLVSTFGVKPYIIADRNDESISRVFSLIDEFEEYSDMFIDEVYAQEIMSSDGSLLVITDASSVGVFASADIFLNSSNVVIIDHHAIQEQLPKSVLPRSIIDPTASSASEIVCEILELSLRPEALRPEEAQILLVGILLDTQFFTHDTGTRTYSACIFLKNAGADVAKAQSFFKSDLEQFRAVSLIEQKMEVYRGRYALSCYTESADVTNKVTASKAADRLISIDGISASFVIYTLETGVSLSARSDGAVNVGKIAEMLGGGGHFQSAGATITKNPKKANKVVVRNIDEALTMLREAIDKYDGSVN